LISTKLSYFWMDTKLPPKGSTQGIGAPFSIFQSSVFLFVSMQARFPDAKPYLFYDFTGKT